MLFTLQDGNTLRQWLAVLQQVELSPREAKSKPGSGLGLLSTFQRSLKTDTGNEYSFPQSPVAIELQTFGPVLAAGANWGLPDARVFRVPYRFDAKSHAHGTLFFTAPHPPLHTMAGILGLTIDSSSKSPGKRLIVRVVAARGGERLTN